MSTGKPDAQAPLLYKYVSFATLRTILEGTIRFTQPNAFNDPFELLPEVITGNEEQERKINMSFDLSAARQGTPGEPSEPIPEGHNSSDAMSRDIVQQLSESIGILCLSRSKNSLLMWSHYADQYAGAVVGFDSAHDFFSGQIEVEYRPTRPRRHLASYLAGNPIPVAELCAKSSEWAYEQEVRVVRRLEECTRAGVDARQRPVFVRALPQEAIKLIILGERSSVLDQRDAFGRIVDTRIALSLAAVDHVEYRFREEIIKYGVPLSEMSPSISPRTAHIFKDLQGTLGELSRWMISDHPASKIVNRPV